MADPNRTESSRRSVTMLLWSSPFPMGIAFYGLDEGGGVEVRADEGETDGGEVGSFRHRLLPEERALLPETVHPRP